MSSSFQPLNPDFDAVVRDSFARQPFMSEVGARIALLEPGICEIHVDMRKGLTQQHGFFHGGLVTAITDSAAGYASYSLYPENSTVLTVDLNVKFLKPAQGSLLRARAEVVKTGKTLYISRADAFAEEGEASNHCLTGLFSMMCLPGKPDHINFGRNDSAA
ncbi:MAG: PaaI family thioesterase [Alphaproteobacteria bacterium]|nr:MAG: PaaI family thioesterase [Alphaproteobacteria bacterium]